MLISRIGTAWFIRRTGKIIEIRESDITVFPVGSDFLKWAKSSSKIKESGKVPLLSKVCPDAK